MNILNNDSTVNKIFELLGSTEHYASYFNFNIIHMVLKINPDFNSKTLIDCEQKITIKVLQDLKEIEFDVAEMKIEKDQITSSNVKISNVKISEKDDKMNIQFGKLLNKGTIIDLDIKYSPGYFSLENTVPTLNPPRSGFHFISKDQDKPAIQAWTQGQALESRYWFPCVDDPQMKYPREIHITVPSEEYTVISNSLSNDPQKKIEESDNTIKNVKWIWNETSPIPAYLTSVVIGKFLKKYVDYDNGRVSLRYFWPLDITEYNAMLTFKETPDIMGFYEEYFGALYPYKQYSQVTVEDFEFGGMENTSCTTLTRNILHDENVLPDYTSDIMVVAHELAHQWFGDLVTCKDWSNIWLNEGFASYSEALYWEASRKQDEFLFKMHQDMTGYLDESNKLYKRSIVQRTFKHPDDLFDAHSYQKGSCVLHMLRRQIGNTYFKNSLQVYISTYKYSNAETDDFRKICEKISGINLQQFFDQWLFTKGHPILEIEYSLNEQENSKKLKVKILQVQDDNTFVFPLDIQIVFTNEINIKGLEKYQITERVFEKEIDIPQGQSIKYISIDPNLNLLKEIKSIKILEEKNDFQLKEILLNQLKNGSTIIERIQAANILKNHYSEEILYVLKNIIVSGDFYGLLVEVANVIGSFNDKSNYSKANNAYNILINCLDQSEFSAPQVLRSVIQNLGSFEKFESVPKLLQYLQKSENFFIQSTIATAIGKSSKYYESFQKEQKENIIKKLQELVNGPSTFQQIVARGAIDGLKEFYKDDDANILIDIAKFLIEKTENNNNYFIRSSATVALGKFLINDNRGETRLDKDKNRAIKEMNQQVFDCLSKLLQDERRKIKINACNSLSNIDAKTSTLEPRLVKSIKLLVEVAEHDIDGFVRSSAERSANIVREWIKDLVSNPPKIDVKLREKRELDL